MVTTRVRSVLTAGLGLTLVASGAASAAAAPATAVSGGWVDGNAAKRGAKVRLAGEASGAARTVRVERLVSGVWRRAATATVSRGHWSTKITAPSTPSSQRYRLVWASSGGALTSKRLPVLDVYRLNTYSVRTRGTVVSDREAVAAVAKTTYADPRGWRRAHQRFARVARGGDFTLVLAQAKTLPRFSSTCDSRYSCRVGRYVIVNDTPWRKKTRAFSGSLTAYRRMVINHETGHWLGLGHRYCGAKGAEAPVMQQQSKSMQGCRANSWPLSSEIARVR